MLQKIGFLPGFNKQITPTGAEAQWTGGENVRFRYGTPEKIGGWSSLGDKKLTGATRAIHQMVNKNGIKYSLLGTNRILYVYSGGVFYDIHPLVNPSGTAITNCFSTTNGDATVTITFPSSHNFQAGDIILFGDTSTFSSITGSNYGASDFCDKKFMVASVPSATTITIEAESTEGGSGATTSGGITYYQYYHVGPADQVGVYGWGISQFGGTVTNPQTNTLDGALGDNVYGTGGSGTSIVLDSISGFPTTGTNYILVGTEEISYTGVSGTTTLTGITRAVRGTTRAAHSDGATVTNTSDYAGWGQAATTTDKVAEPGLWSIDNLGTTALALIVNGGVFEWDADASNATGNRATIVSGAPTASRDMLISTPDRHLVLFGTETTIGDTDSQDDMFIRFSSQESIDESDSYTVKANNTAGTQRLADGSKIMGAIKGRDAIYVWTDTALFLMKFVGQPFTFSFEQVGTNCGLFGKNACIEVDGTAYWMSENGFFQYDGQLKSLPCLVEDAVFDDLNSTARDLVNAGLNNLFGEISWFYCTSASDVVNRVVTYNYLDSTIKRPIWTTGTLARTAWKDSAVFSKPHATYYSESDDASFDVTGNTDGSTIYYTHEIGTDQIVAGGVVTAVIGSITSGDFDITQKTARGGGQVVGMPDIRGDGEFIMRISRFIPDFISQTGNTQVSFVTKNYPNSSGTTTDYSTSTSTTKIDTRLRARSIAMKIANTTTSEDWKLGTFRLDIHPGGRR